MPRILLCSRPTLLIAFIISKLALAQKIPFPTEEAIAKAQVGQLVLNPDTLRGCNID